MKKDSSQQLRRDEKITYLPKYPRLNMPPHPPQSFDKQMSSPPKPEPQKSQKLYQDSHINDQYSGISSRSGTRAGSSSQQYLQRAVFQENSQRVQQSHSNDKKIADRKLSQEQQYKEGFGSARGKAPNHSTNKTDSDEPHPSLEQQRNRNQYATSSQGRLMEPKTVVAQNSKALEKTNSVAVLHEYRHLHEKLNTLENKILSMRTNLEKKKQDKKKFLEAQIRDRKERQRLIREEAEKKEREERRDKQRQDAQRRDLENRRRLEQSKQKEQEKKSTKKPEESSILKGLVTQVPHHHNLKTFQFNPYSPRNNIYYVSQVLKAYRQENSLVRQHLLYSMHLLKTIDVSKRPSLFEAAAKGLNLAKKDYYKDKKTVVFDLDETLIHCNENTSIPYDLKLPIKFPTGEVIEAGINVRPYATEILKNLSANFEVIVFTASHSCYANVVLDALDPEKKYIQHRLFREHCHQTADGMFIKDLRVINRPLSDIVLVDNAAYSYAFQVDNGIPIIPYYEGRLDFELSSLERYLNSLVLAKDVRQENRRTFKLEHYNNFDDPDKLVRELYSHPK